MSNPRRTRHSYRLQFELPQCGKCQSSLCSFVDARIVRTLSWAPFDVSWMEAVVSAGCCVLLKWSVRELRLGKR